MKNPPAPLRTLAAFLCLIATAGLGAAHAQEATAMVKDQCAGANDKPMDASLLPSLEPGAISKPTPPEEMAAYGKMMMEQRARDWANMCRYRAKNAAITQAPRVVFMGDSITEAWAIADPALFAKDFAGRGISGQTSPQMLVRFRNDVVSLHPSIVHIMAGTNDLAGNTGPTSEEDFKANIMAMAELAKANKIQVALASILPVTSFPWRPSYMPRPQILSLNAWMRDYAKKNGFIYVNYYDAVAAPDGAFRASLSNDGVHPNFAGYAVMKDIAVRTLAK